MLQLNPTTPIFDLKGVDVAYKDHLALQAIDLSIHPGEKVAVVGPSGAGKTTLLRKLYELQPQRCAMIHQHYALVPQLSVQHNIYIGRLDRYSTWTNLRNLIRPQVSVIEEMAPILDMLGLSEKRAQRVDALSGGQRQRVAVGRALYHGGNILLADEPVASLDPLQGEMILETIFDTDDTVVAALHSVTFALRFARRIIGLCGGRIRFDRPSDSLDEQQLSDLYHSC